MGNSLAPRARRSGSQTALAPCVLRSADAARLEGAACDDARDRSSCAARDPCSCANHHRPCATAAAAPCATAAAGDHCGCAAPPSLPRRPPPTQRRSRRYRCRVNCFFSTTHPRSTHMGVIMSLRCEFLLVGLGGSRPLRRSVPTGGMGAEIMPLRSASDWPSAATSTDERYNTVGCSEPCAAVLSMIDWRFARMTQTDVRRRASYRQGGRSEDRRSGFLL